MRRATPRKARARAMLFFFLLAVRVSTCSTVINSAEMNFERQLRTGFPQRKELSMRSCSGKHFEQEAESEASCAEAPELSGPLGNLIRLLFSEAWRTKSQPTNKAATFDLTNLSRDFMRRN